MWLVLGTVSSWASYSLALEAMPQSCRTRPSHAHVVNFQFNNSQHFVQRIIGNYFIDSRQIFLKFQEISLCELTFISKSLPSENKEMYGHRALNMPKLI